MKTTFSFKTLFFLLGLSILLFACNTTDQLISRQSLEKKVLSEISKKGVSPDKLQGWCPYNCHDIRCEAYQYGYCCPDTLPPPPDTIALITNPNNPDDSVGSRHNGGLRVIMLNYNSGALQPTWENVTSYTKNYLGGVGYDTNFLDSVFNYGIQNDLIDTTFSNGNIDSLGQALYNRGYISSHAESYLTALSNLINSLDDSVAPTASMYNNFANQAIYYENLITNDTLTPMETTMLLSAYSVARYSCDYWCNYYNSLSLPPLQLSISNRSVIPEESSEGGWFHWKSVVKWDVCGALGGAIGGGAVALMSGGTLSTAVVQGAVGVGIASSVTDAAVQLWDHYL